MDALIRRAKDDGYLRPDLERADLLLADVMVDAARAYTAPVAPERWRRSLALVLDGLRARRDGPAPLPQPPLDEATANRAMALSGSYARPSPGRPAAAGRLCLSGAATVPAVEPLDPAGGVHDAGAAGVEGMAGRGDLHVDDGVGSAVLPFDGLVARRGGAGQEGVRRPCRGRRPGRRRGGCLASRRVSLLALFAGPGRGVRHRRHGRP
jgi:hypothetical protein